MRATWRATGARKTSNSRRSIAGGSAPFTADSNCCQRTNVRRFSIRSAPATAARRVARQCGASCRSRLMTIAEGLALLLVVLLRRRGANGAARRCRGAGLGRGRRYIRASPRHRKSFHGCRNAYARHPVTSVVQSLERRAAPPVERPRALSAAPTQLRQTSTASRSIVRPLAAVVANVPSWWRPSRR